MLFHLTTLNSTKFLIEIIPQSSENEYDRTIMVVVDAWNHIDFVCKNYILNELDNTLYDVYNLIKSEKVLWKAIYKKYRVENVGMEKFIIKQFLNFKMVDSMTVMSQVQEFKLILHDIHVEGIYINESF